MKEITLRFTHAFLTGSEVLQIAALLEQLNYIYIDYDFKDLTTEIHFTKEIVND